MRACDPSSSPLDREDLNVGIITIRKRESASGREANTNNIYVMSGGKVDVGVVGEIGGSDSASRFWY